MILFVYPSAVMQPEYATAKQYIIGGLYDHVSLLSLRPVKWTDFYVGQFIV